LVLASESENSSKRRVQCFEMAGIRKLVQFAVRDDASGKDRACSQCRGESGYHVPDVGLDARGTQERLEDNQCYTQANRPMSVVAPLVLRVEGSLSIRLVPKLLPLDLDGFDHGSGKHGFSNDSSGSRSYMPGLISRLSTDSSTSIARRYSSISTCSSGV